MDKTDKRAHDDSLIGNVSLSMDQEELGSLLPGFWNTITNTLREEGKIVLHIAFSDIASPFLRGGSSLPLFLVMLL